MVLKHSHSRNYSCQGAVLQAIYSYSDEGGISKMLANHLGTTSGGDWVLPVWREMGGQQACNMHPELHGAAGVLLSSDQAGLPLLLEAWLWPSTVRETHATCLSMPCCRQSGCFPL